MLRRIRVLVVLASMVGALTVGAAGASAANWAGLGDSYAAGPLIPNQQLNPLGCLRSDHNFAHLAAAALGRSLADASCSGAKTDDMTAPQSVTPARTRRSSTRSPPTPRSSRCRSAATTSASRASSRTAPPRTRSRTRAATATSSTATTRSPTRSTPPRRRWRRSSGDPHALATGAGVRRQLRGDPPRDRRRLLAAGPDRLLRRGLPAQRREKPQRDARPAGRHQRRAIVDDYSASIGRDACKSPSTRWVEPLGPANLAAPFHPNARGEAGIAAVVVGAVSS